MTRRSGIRPPGLRRSWLFVGGTDEDALSAAADSGADALIHELEDFTAPGERPAARALIPRLMAAWRAAGCVATVRINPLETADGPTDLAAAFADPATGVPDAVLLPKVAEPDQVRALAEAVSGHERACGLPAGTVELVPNIELARGLMQTFAVARAAPAVSACLVASEDMAADLGAERGRDGRELAYVRERFHLECRAADVVSIDCPYTFTDAAGLSAEARDARRLGYTAKSLVRADHAPVVNEALTPSADEIARAERVVAAHEAALAEGRATVELDGVMLEVPIVLNARRLVERARALAAWTVPAG